MKVETTRIMDGRTVELSNEAALMLDEWKLTVAALESLPVEAMSFDLADVLRKHRDSCYSMFLCAVEATPWYKAPRLIRKLANVCLKP